MTVDVQAVFNVSFRRMDEFSHSGRKIDLRKQKQKQKQKTKVFPVDFRSVACYNDRFRASSAVEVKSPAFPHPFLAPFGQVTPFSDAPNDLSGILSAR